MRLHMGMEAAGIRVSLVLQSEDVRAHGYMTDHTDFFNRLTDRLAEEGRVILSTYAKAHPPSEAVHA